jgi:hypothetical protein
MKINRKQEMKNNNLTNQHQYIRELEKENRKLHSEIVKLKLSNLTKTNRIAAIQKELNRLNRNQIDGPILVLPCKTNNESSATHLQMPNGKLMKIKKKG